MELLPILIGDDVSICSPLFGGVSKTWGFSDSKPSFLFSALFFPLGCQMAAARKTLPGYTVATIGLTLRVRLDSTAHRRQYTDASPRQPGLAPPRAGARLPGNYLHPQTGGLIF